MTLRPLDCFAYISQRLCSYILRELLIMYSGITKGLYKVINSNRHLGLLNYTVDLSPSLCANLHIGDSVSVNGVCQTVVNITGVAVTFQAIQETLERTTLNTLQSGDWVSIERSLRFGDEIGGHEVSGHVFGTGRIAQIITHDHNLTLVIQCNPDWMKYILTKGFIAVDGSSLTVGKTIPDQGLFYLHLIPETLRLTNFGNKKQHETVNIEFDYKTKTIVDTVERVLLNNPNLINGVTLFKSGDVA